MNEFKIVVLMMASVCDVLWRYGKFFVFQVLFLSRISEMLADLHTQPSQFVEVVWDDPGARFFYRFPLHHYFWQKICIRMY